MQTIITKEYKGITLTFGRQEYKKNEAKIIVEFPLNGTTYRNAEIVPDVSTAEDAIAVLTRLETWAQTIINENTK